MQRMSTHADVRTLNNETAEAGERIYQQRLKSKLEPAHNGRLVAIHLPSQEYFLGNSILEAVDHLREKHPNATRGDVYTRGVGKKAVAKAHTPRITGAEH